MPTLTRAGTRPTGGSIILSVQVGIQSVEKNGLTLSLTFQALKKKTFQKATLKLFHYHTGGGDEAELGVYTVRSDWNEGNGNYTPAAQGPANVAAQGEICWINQPQSDPNPVAYFNPGTTINDFVEVDITPLVNSWINGMENHGLAIKTGENYLNGPESMYGFYSREHEEMDKRPQLIIKRNRIKQHQNGKTVPKKRQLNWEHLDYLSLTKLELTVVTLTWGYFRFTIGAAGTNVYCLEDSTG